MNNHVYPINQSDLDKFRLSELKNRTFRFSRHEPEKQFMLQPTHQVPKTHLSLDFINNSIESLKNH